MADKYSQKIKLALSVPQISASDRKYVRDCLQTGWVSSAGPFVKRFEKQVANYLNRKHAVVCVSGTAALHVALMISGVKAGDEVLMPALTFAAPAFAVRYVDAWPVFMDVEAQYWQMDLEKTEIFLKKCCVYKNGKVINRRTRRTVKAIMPVHILGHPVDMDPLNRLAKKYGLVVIEDAAESLGAEYKGRKVGSLSDISCLSFNGNKTITCGGGGMLLTDKKKWACQGEYLTTQAKDDPVEYVHNNIGYNYRLSSVHAALGLGQMEKLDAYVEKKRRIAKNYEKEFNLVPGVLCPKEASWAKSTYWLFTILVEQRQYGLSSRKLMAKLAACGIQSRPLWHPLHSLSIFKKSFAFEIQEANKIYARALSLPSSVGLKHKDQRQVINLIKNQ